MPTADRLEMWTVYDRPAERPNAVIARRFTVAGPVITEIGEVIAGPTLEAVRAQLPPGLLRLPPGPGDEPSVVEVWI
ncbi:MULTISPECIES: hypothetical protein [Cupriavidus]